MTKKNWGLLIILLVLTGTFGVLLNRNGMATSLEVDEELFAVADTAAIQRIELQQAGGERVQLLERQGSSWQLNQTYQADGRLVRLLLSVLRNVEIKRPLATRQQEATQQALKQEGTRVRVYDASGLMQDFYAGGEEAQQLSYFMQDDEVYVMELPGYVNYISGIFQLNENNLRNKTIFDANHFNLQSVEVSYPEQPEENLRIDFDGARLEVAGVVQPDSIQLLSYLDLFNEMQAVGFVNAREYPELDSLLQEQPQAHIEVRTVQHPDGKQLSLYPSVLDNSYRLGWLPEEEQAVLLDDRLARQLLLRRSQLERRGSE